MKFLRFLGRSFYYLMVLLFIGFCFGGLFVAYWLIQILLGS